MFSLGLVRVTGGGPARLVPGRMEGLVSSLQVASLKLEGAMDCGRAEERETISLQALPGLPVQAGLCPSELLSCFSLAATAVPPLHPWPSQLLSGCALLWCVWRQGSMPIARLHRLLQRETCACLLLQFPQDAITATLLKGMKWSFAFHHQHC